MAKKHTDTMGTFENIIGKDHQFKITDEDKREVSMTKACFSTFSWEIDAMESTDLTLTQDEDNEMVYILSNGLNKDNVTITITPQMHDRGETHATQKTFKLFGTSLKDAQGTHMVKVDWNNKLKVFQIWSKVGTKSYHRAFQGASKDKMFKAFEAEVQKGKDMGMKVFRSTEVPENLDELIA